MEAMTDPSGRLDALETLTAPVVILVGSFGSGKSEIAVNLSLGFAARGQQVNLVDLDVVKPYFRCRAAREEVRGEGRSSRGARAGTASSPICRSSCRR